MPDTSTRLPGHGLEREGKPFQWSDRDGQYVRPWGHPRTGVAKCSCGAVSPVLGSDGARKRWHRDVHKPEMRAQAK